MKLLLSKIFYYAGDLISKTTMQWGDGWGYRAYNKLMLWSIDLDTEEKIWKKVLPPKKKKLKKNK